MSHAEPTTAAAAQAAQSPAGAGAIPAAWVLADPAEIPEELVRPLLAACSRWRTDTGQRDGPVVLVVPARLLDGAGTGDRAPVPEGPVLLDPLRIDGALRSVTVYDRLVPLSLREYELLRFLATHPSRIFGREALLRAVWGEDRRVGTRTVDVHVRRLRAKLGPELTGWIRTVRSVGYAFVPSH